jgi:glycine C-acetyltransferase
MVNDIFKRLESNKGPIGKYADLGEDYFFFPKLEGDIGPKMNFKEKQVLNWSLNDYLGLSNHPEVKQIDVEAALQFGAAYPMGARMMSGNSKYHIQLEKELAKFTSKESAYLLNFGYQGMLSMIDALVSKNDAIVYDADVHACIIDGIRFKPKGNRFMYRHNDLKSIESNLKRATSWVTKTGGGILFITEGIFGMQGQQGKLKEIVALKAKYNFM